MISEQWHGVQLEDDTHWPVVQDINKKVLLQLQVAGLFSPDLAREDVRLAVEHWTFPLSSVALEPRKVTVEELRRQREQAAVLAKEPREPFVESDLEAEVAAYLNKGGAQSQ